jgi:hypothetical protein
VNVLGCSRSCGPEERGFLLSAQWQCTCINSVGVLTDPPKDLVVDLDYLVSYERMGFFRVTCEGGCTCGDHTIDGYEEMEDGSPCESSICLVWGLCYFR